MGKTLPSNGISSRSGRGGGGRKSQGGESEELAVRESEQSETQAL